MEELKENIIKRVKAANSSVEEFRALDKCSLGILERLAKVQKDRNLAIMVRNLEDFYYANKYKERIKLNEEIILIMINLIDKNNVLGERYDNIITSKTLSADQKVEGLKKMIKAKEDFQVEIISYVYCLNMPYQDIISDIILTCSYKFQTYYIYNIVTFMNYDEEAQEFASILLEIAQIIAKVKDDDIACLIKEIARNKSILKSGWTLSAVHLLKKCQNADQLFYVSSILEEIGEKISPEQIPYAILASNYFLLTKHKDILKNLYMYIRYNLRRNLPVSLENVNLIINARHNYNGKNITDALTDPVFIENNQEEVMANVYNDSRKKYHADLIKDNLQVQNPELYVGGSMLVNEAENRKKALTITNTLTNLTKTNEKNTDALVFASLINRVYTDVEINLISNIAQNKVLNKLEVALPLARLIALEEEEFDKLMIWQAYQNKETKEKFVFGIWYIYENTLPEYRKKTEKIINKILIDIINTQIVYGEEKEDINITLVKR